MGIFEERIQPQLKKGFGEINPQTLVECAEQIGQELASDKEDGLKNHQLRKFYDAVKQIERHTLSLKPDDPLPNERIAQLLFLRPHLANAERKAHGIRPLRNVLDPCLASNVIEKKADLTRFVKFFEAIVAYAN
jgi:CRISPR type III-A-associated protein Csm2